ncbi:hypothetical protein [Paenibacillus kyungheensis]
MTIDNDIDLLKNNSPIIRCIYCGKSTDEGIKLNVSDIFPLSLSNEKLKNKNVCSIEHNSNFSKYFESCVINSLAIVRNHLNIKNHGNKYPPYYINYIIKGEKYPILITKPQDFLKDRMIPSEDKKSFFGTLESFRKRKDFKEGNEILFDINNEEIVSESLIEVDIYLTRKMKRMIAKIAYEWHCKLENINNRYSKYDSIINYITKEQLGDEPERVRLITEPLIYDFLRRYLPLGNHLLLRINKHNKVFVYICLFGIAIYEVELLDNQRSKDLEFELRELSQAKNIKHFKERFNPSEISIENEEMINIATFFSMDLKLNSAPQNKDFIFKFLYQNTKDLLDRYYVTKLSLQRFVEDYELNKGKELLLNYDGIVEKHFWCLLKVVYFLGENNLDIAAYDMKTIEEIILEQHAHNNFSLSCFKKILQKDKHMVLKINRGAKIILQIND